MDTDALDEIRANIHGRTGPISLGACIFAGGFSLGMEQAGFEIVGHLESDVLELGSRVAAQRWPVQLGPMAGWQGLAQEFVTDGLVPDVLHANPPCVAYAGPGNHLGSTDDRMCYTRGCTYDLAMSLRPKVWVWELVDGIFGKERSFLEAMAFRAAKLGYRSTAFLTTSANHGGFQDRRRFHFIASKVELDFDGVYADEPPERKGVRPIGDALDIVLTARQAGELANDREVYSSKGAFKAIMPFCPPGSHLRDVPKSVYEQYYRPRGKVWVDGAGVPGFTHTRARRDKPSPNVLGGHTIMHPEEDRYLTPRECATIMGFPLDFKFTESSQAHAEIGCGLCTHNAAFVGRVIRRALERDVGATPHRPGETMLDVVDWRGLSKRTVIKMSQAERNTWWRQRHGTEPPAGVWG